MTQERPILFSAEMVRAILREESPKTQTRRVVTLREFGVTDTPGYDFRFRDRRLFWHNYRAADFIARRCPYGKPGDRLWVRETFCVVDDTEHGGERWVDYRATPRYSEHHPAGWDSAPNDAEALKWKPSIHMPRWASRITLEVTDIRVERVQDIGTLDAMAEGAAPLPVVGGTASYTHGFRVLWDSINAKRGYGWDVNPWCWVVTFRRLGAA